MFDAVLDDELASSTFKKSIQEFAELFQRRQKLEAELKLIISREQALQPILLEHFASLGLQSVKLDDATIHLRTEIFYSILPEFKAAAIEKAREAELEDMITLQPMRLAAYIREQVSLTGDVPKIFEGMVKTTEKVSVRARNNN